MTPFSYVFGIYRITKDLDTLFLKLTNKNKRSPFVAYRHFTGSIFLTTVHPIYTTEMQGNSGDKSAGKCILPETGVGSRAKNREIKWVGVRQQNRQRQTRVR